MHRTHILLIGTLLLGLLSACQPGKERTQMPISTPTTELPPTPSSTHIPPTETLMPTDTLPPATPTRHIVQSLRELADLGTGKGPVYSQDWSPNGLLLVTADTELIRIWDVTAHQESGVLSGHTDYIWGLKWSPVTATGVSTLASASQDGTVRLWKHTGWAFCVAWSPDGQRIAVGAYQTGIQIWDVSTQELLHTWESSTNSPIISIAWSPDGSSLASGELYGDIYLWDVATGQVRQAITGGAAVGSPDRPVGPVDQSSYRLGARPGLVTR